MSVNWSKFGSNYVAIEEGVKKTLTVTNLRDKQKVWGINEPKTILEMDVLVEDGVSCDPPRSWEVNGIKCIKKIQPIAQKAESEGRQHFSISVLRLGSGTAAKYDVQEIV